MKRLRIVLPSIALSGLTSININISTALLFTNGTTMPMCVELRRGDIHGHPEEMFMLILVTRMGGSTLRSNTVLCACKLLPLMVL